MKENIVLIGMPTAGKSTAGVIAAKVLGYEFMDSDLLIQKEYNCLLKDIIATKGVDGFIEVENQVNASIKATHSIIATGGSVVYGKDAMSHLREIGTVIYIKLDYDTIINRLGNVKQRGVVLRKGQTLQNLYDERCSLYETYADVIIDAKDLSVEELVEQIVEVGNENNRK